MGIFPSAFHPRVFSQSVSTCIWCPPLTWTSTASAPCRSRMKTSTCGTYTTPASNWSCGPSAHCDDTAETPLGSHLSLEGGCAAEQVSVACFQQEDVWLKCWQQQWGRRNLSRSDKPPSLKYPTMSTFAVECFRHWRDGASACLYSCIVSPRTRAYLVLED